MEAEVLNTQMARALENFLPALNGHSAYLFLVVIFIVGFVIKWAVSAFHRSLILDRSYVQKIPEPLSSVLSSPISAHLGLFVGAVFWVIALNTLKLPAEFKRLLLAVAQFFVAYALVKVVVQAVDSVGAFLTRFLPKKDGSLDAQLIELMVKTVKVFLIIFATLFYLQSLGLNVISLLAGLGLVGAAIAFAAQKTGENFFGSISVVMDKPFKVGDHVRIGSVEGTVEAIGFRSTQIRTFAQSLVSIPNGIVAGEIIDNMGIRPKRETRMQLGFTYKSTPEQMAEFCQKAILLINEKPGIATDDTVCVFSGFGDFSLNLSLRYFLETNELKVEQRVRQEIGFSLIKLAESLKLEFAFPTQTLHIESFPAR